MIFLFGHKVLGKIVKEGIFNCPHCTKQQSFELKKRWNFLTLFFVPLIPLEKLPDRLICKKCRKVFYPESVLSKYEYQPSHLIRIQKGAQELNFSLASYGKRMAAHFIDVTLLTLLNFPLAIFINKLPGKAINFLPQNFIVTFLAVWLCYFFLMDAYANGQTIGKKLMKIMVIQIDTTHPPEPGNALIRSIIKLISGPLLLVFFFTHQNKALHDLAAGTVVVEN